MKDVEDFKGHTICRWDSDDSIVELKGAHQEMVAFPLGKGHRLKINGRGCHTQINHVEWGTLLVVTYADNVPYRIKKYKVS
jgi:hypothetical protein